MKTTINVQSKQADALSEVATPPKKKLKVCHLSMTLETGGLERLLVDYGRFHDAERFDLSFVALEGIGTPGDQLREAGFRIDQVRLSQLGKV
ncbi:lipopolysaccharide biosynthesis protein, partial [Planctomicrobium sp.]|nr:lipopolysaccharide biosynthesis protein [Planctomicrobium sp.]